MASASDRRTSETDLGVGLAGADGKREQISAAIRDLQTQLTALDRRACRPGKTRRLAIQQAGIPLATGYGWFNKEQPHVPNTADDLWHLVEVYLGWLGPDVRDVPRSRSFWNDLWSKADHAPRSTVPKVSPRVLPLLKQQVLVGGRFPYGPLESSLRRLAELYVPQTLTPWSQAQNLGEGDREASGSLSTPDLSFAEPGGTTDSGLSIEDALTKDDSDVLVMAGPGGGKSVLAARLAATLSEGVVAGSGDAEYGYPFLVSARELEADPGLLDRTLSLAQQARWLLIVDAVDEIADPAARRALVIRLGALREESGLRLRVLITTRPLSEAEFKRLTDDGYKAFALQPFGREELRNFARRWFTPVRREGVTAEAYLQQIAQAGLTELAGTPLLATVAATLLEVAPERPLPSNRYVLYERYRLHLATSKARRAEDAIDEMMRDLGVLPEVQRALTLLRAETEDYLAYLAEELLDGTTRDLVDHVLGRLHDAVGGLPEGARDAWRGHAVALLSRTGLLVGNHDSVSFVHVSFAEHLAAGRRAKRLPAFAENSDDWNVLLRCFARGTSDAFDTVVHRCFQSRTDSEALIDRLQACGFQWQELAARLLAEGVPAAARQYTHYADVLLAREVTQLDNLAGRISHPSVTQALLDLAALGHERAVKSALILASLRHPEAPELLLSAMGKLAGVTPAGERMQGRYIPSPNQDGFLSLIGPVVDALIELGAGHIVPQLFPPLLLNNLEELLDDLESLHQRMGVAKALAHADHKEEAVDLLLEYFKSHRVTSDEAFTVCEFISELGYGERVDRVWRWLIFDSEDTGYQLESIAHWIHLGHRHECIEVLQRIARDQALPDYHRLEAMQKLYELDTLQEFIPDIRSALTNDDRWSAKQCAQLLCDAGNGEELPELLRTSTRDIFDRCGVSTVLLDHGLTTAAVTCLRDAVVLPGFFDGGRQRIEHAGEWWGRPAGTTGSRDVCLEVCRLLHRCGLLREAADVAERLLSLDDNPPVLQGDLCVLLFELGEREKVGDALLRMVVAPQATRADQQQALTALAAWRLPGTAVALADTAVRISEDPSPSHHAEMIDLLVSIGRREDARRLVLNWLDSVRHASYGAHGPVNALVTNFSPADAARILWDTWEAGTSVPTGLLLAEQLVKLSEPEKAAHIVRSMSTDPRGVAQFVVRFGDRTGLWPVLLDIVLDIVKERATGARTHFNILRDLVHRDVVPTEIIQMVIRILRSRRTPAGTRWRVAAELAKYLPVYTSEAVEILRSIIVDPEVTEDRLPAFRELVDGGYSDAACTAVTEYFETGGNRMGGDLAFMFSDLCRKDSRAAKRHADTVVSTLREQILFQSGSPWLFIRFADALTSLGPQYCEDAELSNRMLDLLNDGPLDSDTERDLFVVLRRLGVADRAARHALLLRPMFTPEDQEQGTRTLRALTTAGCQREATEALRGELRDPQAQARVREMSLHWLLVELAEPDAATMAWEVFDGSPDRNFQVRILGILAETANADLVAGVERRLPLLMYDGSVPGPIRAAAVELHRRIRGSTENAR
ncbi:NACHT domain-containing protein [Streptomyces europaeiscabiei]|uniref:NACHT domain-containing protein n=1 Tax=Streptomyces europaeiscabiei TaxID=146819 RepID=UPI0029BDE748|nr:NACHT domain-containing protein [Streptomyces europaeiscabiei]MDX3775911.1 NACHT domain-containing protein [Streptomyces europaeiscabiei]